jgi:hypothetical protein
MPSADDISPDTGYAPPLLAQKEDGVASLRVANPGCCTPYGDQYSTAPACTPYHHAEGRRRGQPLFERQRGPVVVHLQAAHPKLHKELVGHASGIGEEAAGRRLLRRNNKQEFPAEGRFYLIFSIDRLLTTGERRTRLPRPGVRPLQPDASLSWPQRWSLARQG